MSRINIILFTVIIKAILTPLVMPSMKTMKKQRDLQPELDKLKEKYKHDKKKMAEMQMELFKQHGLNPASGCVTQIATIVVLIALYGVIQRFAINADVDVLNTLIYFDAFKFKVGDTTIVGRYDRVDVGTGSKIRIIDYKSSENIDQERADAQAKESTQLAIYALSYYKMVKIIPEWVGLHFLESGIEGGYQPAKKDLDQAEELIKTTAEKIARDVKNNTFEANPKYFGREPACVYCAYNSICPFSLAKVK